MAYRKRTFKKAKRTFKRKSYAKKSRKVSPLKKMVKQIIARNVENKSKQFWVNDQVLYPSNATNFPNNVLQICPNSSTLAIVQGLGQGGRIGNEIKTRKLVMEGIFAPLPYDATTNANPRPVEVQMIFFYDREDPNNPPIVGSTFFQDGSNSTGFQNTLVDLIKPVNEDRYRVFSRKTFKLGYSQYAGSATNTTNQSIFQAYSNNDFKANHRFKIDCTKWYPKTVKFNDNLSDPMTRGLYCLVQYVDAFGQSFLNSSAIVELTYSVNMVYEDA